MERVRDIEHLKELAKHRSFECKLLLQGNCFSRKTIYYDPSGFDGTKWSIYNHIDDTYKFYESDIMLKEFYPLLFDAIEAGALIFEPELCYD